METASNSGALNDLSEAIRTPETRRLLEKLDQTLGAPAFADNADVGAASIFREVTNLFRRARKLFGADLFFVVIFGALKSGKSTLTNALVEAEISPMGYGRDTTQRPCLILRGPENRCSQFFLRRTARRPAQADDAAYAKAVEDERGRAFDLVSDYLKGVADVETLKASVEMKEFSFDRAELEKKLTNRIDSLDLEPLITVVWVTTGAFLESGICLIDMPGLDSVEHNSEADSIHNWVIEDADFFLFLQSSVAALNERTQQFLKRISDSQKQQPMWALQNVLDARHWRDPEVRVQEFANQQTDALAKIQQVLKSPKGSEPKSQWFNLGLEWDGIAQGHQEWRSLSRFEEFKIAVTQQLTNDRAHIKERNCLDNLAAAAKLGLSKITAVRQVQGQVLERCLAIERLALDEMPQAVSKFSYFTQARLREVRITLAGRLDAQYATFKSSIEAKSKDRRSHARELKKSDLEKARVDYLNDLKKVADESFKFEGEFRRGLESTISDKMDGANNDPELAALDALWKQIESDTSLIRDLKNLAPPELTQFNSDIDVSLENVTNYPNWLSIFDSISESRFNADTVAGVIDELTEEFLRKAEERFESWKLNIAEPFKTYDATRRDWLKAKADAESSAILARLAPEKESARLAIEKCAAFQQLIAELQPAIDTALLSAGAP